MLQGFGNKLVLDLFLILWIWVECVTRLSRYQVQIPNTRNFIRGKSKKILFGNLFLFLPFSFDEWTRTKKKILNLGLHSHYVRHSAIPLTQTSSREMPKILFQASVNQIYHSISTFHIHLWQRSSLPLSWTLKTHISSTNQTN